MPEQHFEQYRLSDKYAHGTNQVTICNFLLVFYCSWGEPRIPFCLEPIRPPLSASCTSSPIIASRRRTVGRTYWFPDWMRKRGGSIGEEDLLVPTKMGFSVPPSYTIHIQYIDCMDSGISSAKVSRCQRQFQALEQHAMAVFDWQGMTSY